MPLPKQTVLCLYSIKTATPCDVSGKKTMMKKRNKESTWKLIAFLLTSGILFFLSCTLTVEAQQSQRPFDFLKKTIVIDPGHGGRDTGARGPEGTFEKTVTLALARMIASELENNYRVVLTRTGDYLLNITERTSMANNLKADLFISLHTGGSMLHTVSGRSIFYYQNLKKPDISVENDTLNSSQNNISVPWHTLQYRHKTASRKLAKIMKNYLEQDTETTLNIQDAPILILEGADMPAILLEAGYLTNPAQERSLNNKQSLYDLAQQITRGINDFLTHDQ